MAAAGRAVFVWLRYRDPVRSRDTGSQDRRGNRNRIPESLMNHTD